MLQKCITPLKSLLAVVLALSLVLMGQPAEALAADVTYKVTCTSAGNGKVIAAYDSEGSELDWYEAGSVWDAIINGNNSVRLKQLKEPAKVEPDSGYVLDYWIADKDLYINGGWGFIGYATTISKGSELRSSLSSYYVYAYEDLTLTAHFKRKPAAVMYTTDGHGSVGRGDESVEINAEYKCDEETLAVGKLAGTTATPTDSNKYKFKYWTADQDIYKLEDDKLTTITAGTELASTEGYFVTGDVNFTAHFKQIAADVTYESAGHGSVSKDSEKVTFSEETIDAAGTKAMAGTPTGATPSPDEDYNFKYWTASTDVIVPSDFSTITAGSEISNDQLSSILVTGDVTFTAHFNAKPVTVSYATDGNGTVTRTSQEVQRASTHPLASDPTKEITVGQPRYGVDTTPNNNFRLYYWTASEDVYVLDSTTMQLSVYKAGTHLPNENVELYYVLKDTTYTAHFLRTVYDITYKTAGHGAVSPASERIAADSTPTGCAITPDDGYDFEYWTADVSVEVANGDASEEGTTTIAAGEPITDEQLRRAVSFSSDPTFKPTLNTNPSP